MNDRYEAAKTEIRRYREQRDERDLALRLAITYHRTEGVPWSVIAEALGVSKQSAWQKYR